MLAFTLLIGFILAGAVGLVVGSLLHGNHKPVLPDALQGVCGAALCLEVYAVTGPLDRSGAELWAVAVIGAWVSVGAAHATAARLRRLNSGPRRKD